MLCSWYFQSLAMTALWVLGHEVRLYNADLTVTIELNSGHSVAIVRSLHRVWCAMLWDTSHIHSLVRLTSVGRSRITYSMSFLPGS